MIIKTLLKKVERFKSFVYGTAQVMHLDGREALVIDIKPRSNSQPECPECGKRGKIMPGSPLASSSMCRSGRSRFTSAMRPAGWAKRLYGSAPLAIRVAPAWNLKNNQMWYSIINELKRRGSWQGCRLDVGYVKAVGSEW
jgi:hypothetical protein